MVDKMSPRSLLILGLICFAAQDTPVLAQARRPANATATNSYAAGVSAWRQGKTNEAVEILSAIPESHPDFSRAMSTLGLRLLAESAGQPERGLPFVARA